jgi:hypothetical protein
LYTVDKFKKIKKNVCIFCLKFKEMTFYLPIL